MARLFNAETKQWEDVADDNVKDAYLSGKFGFAQGETVTVVGQDGKLWDIPEADVGDAFRKGFSFATSEQLSENRLQKEYGEGLGTEVQAGLEGAARGLLPGISDEVLMRAGVSREGLAERRERNPLAATAGEIGGTVAGLVGPGALGKALGAVPRAIAGGATAVEQAAARAVGTGATSIAGRIAQKSIPLAAGSAVEGAVYGAGQEITESVLGDTELTAERLLAGAGLGAVLGGGAGAALGGLGVATVSAGKAALKGGASVAKKLGIEGTEGLAEQAAFKASGAMLKDFRKASAKAGEVNRIGRDALDEGIVTAGATVDDIAERATKKTQEFGEKQGAMIKRLDDLKTGIEPDTHGLTTRIREEVIAPIKENIFGSDVAKTVQSKLQDFMDTFADRIDDASQTLVPGKRLTFGELHSLRRDLDDIIYRENVPVNPPPWIQEMRKARSIIEDEFTRAGDEAAQTVGESFAKEYQEVKRKYQSMVTLRDMASDKALRQSSNLPFGLTDMLSAVGGVTTFGVGGALAAVGSKALRERGAATMAVALDKVSKLAAVERMNARVQKTMTEGVTGFLSGKKTARTSPRRLIAPFGIKVSSLEGRYEHAVSHVASFLSNPAGSAERIAEAIAPLEQAAPGTSAAMGATAMRAAQFLQSKIPDKIDRADALLPHLQKQRIAQSEMASFLRYARAVDDPQSVIEDLKDRKVTREAVEALQVVYPKMYEQLVQTAMSMLSEAKKPPAYQDRIQLGILLGQPTDPTLQPEFIRDMQAGFAKQAEQAKSAPPSGPSLNMADKMMTSTQALEAR